MKVIGFIAVFIFVMLGLVVLAGQVGLLKGRTPHDIGVKDGRLKPPSLTPNSVSSQTYLYPMHPQSRYAQIDPLKFTGDADRAMSRLADIVKTTERTTVVTQEPGYLYAQSRSPVLRFTDDIEFWLDKPAGVVHVRSASRLGKKDFNVNRTRVEKIRAQFAQTEPGLLKSDALR